ncbi:hypothetical protein JXQ31_20615 [candidate division KSB1 bacterium]|nr:hypothetical protein [candidate division KSB1 bacterium]
MSLRAKIVIVFFIYTGYIFACPPDWRGQISGWAAVRETDAANPQLGIRYIPGVNINFHKTGNILIDSEVSANFFSYRDIQNNAHESEEKLYRCWLRFSSSRFEARIGLQKINFGSALLMRPLMWFDTIDPRDPQQITEGAYGLLLRYYFLNNANIWLWGLYGNNNLKGSEILYTREKTAEFGGRIQHPLGHGEIAATWHHRNIDLNKSIDILLDSPPVNIDFAPVSENRFAVDGKWDYEIGFWVESAVIHQRTDFFDYRYRNQFNIGMDYTFSVGNGLHALFEYYYLTFSKKIEFKNGYDIAAFMVDYPLNILDQLMGLIYFDIRHEDFYNFYSWQRRYDNWSLNAIVFLNPDKSQLAIMQNRDTSSYGSGKGFQFMIIYYY